MLKQATKYAVLELIEARLCFSKRSRWIINIAQALRQRYDRICKVKCQKEKRIWRDRIGFSHFSSKSTYDQAAYLISQAENIVEIRILVVKGRDDGWERGAVT